MAGDPLRVLKTPLGHPFGAIDYPGLPARPRATAVTSVLDGGLGPGEARDRVAIAAEWIDVVKLGWASARLTPAAALRDKVQIYRAAGIKVCSGGTFLEIAFAQDRVREFLDGARELGLTMVEVSNGVHPMSEDEKLGLIAQARCAGFTVWSEVGKKDADEDARIGIDERCSAIVRELEAGAEKVILEARESGTVGIYDRSGKPAADMIRRIVERVGRERLVFEAPRKDQQVWMVRVIGPAVSNVAAIGMTPLRLTSPTVGFSPTTPQALAGERIEPLVSVPIAATQRLADTAAPDPELEPEGFRSNT